MVRSARNLGKHGVSSADASRSTWSNAYRYLVKCHLPVKRLTVIRISANQFGVNLIPQPCQGWGRGFESLLRSKTFSTEAVDFPRLFVFPGKGSRGVSRPRVTYGLQGTIEDSGRLLGLK